MNKKENFNRVFLNDQSFEIKIGASILDLLQLAGLKDFNGVALAINQEVIPKSEWQNHILNNNSQLVLITAAQGG